MTCCSNHLTVAYIWPEWSAMVGGQLLYIVLCMALTVHGAGNAHEHITGADQKLVPEYESAPC